MLTYNEIVKEYTGTWKEYLLNVDNGRPRKYVNMTSMKTKKTIQEMGFAASVVMGTQPNT